MDKRTDHKEILWKPLRTEHIVNDAWIDFRKTTYLMPNGKELGPFYNMTRKNYVVVVATDEDGEYLTVKQFRQGIRKITTEFPAGGIVHIEKANPMEEARPMAGIKEALLAAKRELREETGYESEHWKHMLTVPSAASIADNYAYIFRAKDCRRTSGQRLDDTEFLNVELASKDEISRKIFDGEFEQAVHIMAFYMDAAKEV